MNKKIPLAFVLGLSLSSCSWGGNSVKPVEQTPEMQIIRLKESGEISADTENVYVAKVSEQKGASLFVEIKLPLTHPPTPLSGFQPQRGESVQSHGNLSLKRESGQYNSDLSPVTRHSSHNNPPLKGARGMSTKATQNGTPAKTVNDVNHYLVYLIKNSSPTGYPAGGDPLGTDLVAGPFTINNSGTPASKLVNFTNIPSSSSDSYYVAVRARDASNNDLIKPGTWTGISAATPGVAVSSGNGISVNSNFQVSTTTPFSITPNLLDGSGARIDARVTSSAGGMAGSVTGSAVTYTYQLSTLPITGLIAPRSVAVDKDGNVYIADSHIHLIKKFDGTTTTTPGIYGLLNPFGVAVDKDGNVYIADTDNHAIKKFNGTITTTLVSSGLNFPRSVAVDKDGNVYIADTNNNAIKKFDGTTTTTLVSSGLISPYGIAVDKDGNVYIADTNNNAIKKFDGTTTTTLVSGLLNPFGVAVDKDGNVYIADTFNNAIKKLTKVWE